MVPPNPVPLVLHVVIAPNEVVIAPIEAVLGDGVGIGIRSVMPAIEAYEKSCEALRKLNHECVDRHQAIPVKRFSGQSPIDHLFWHVKRGVFP